MQKHSTDQGLPTDDPLAMQSPPTGKEMPKISIAFMEAAAFLTLWSLCVVIEGGTRFVGISPSMDLSITPAGTPNRIALFLGGLFEVAFGFIGLVIGVGALVYRWFNAKVVKLACLVQTILGIYVFVTFVIVAPAMEADAIPETAPGVSPSQGLLRWLATLGILTGIQLCLALQGGQFLFMARLVSTATGENFLKARSGDKMRALFWNGNFALLGLWTFIFGCTWASNASGAYQAGPHVGETVGYTIFTGLLTFLWGCAGMFLTTKPGLYNKKAYILGTLVVFVILYLNFTIAQLGQVSEPPLAAVGIHTFLVFLVTVLGPFFLHRSIEGTAEDI